MSNNSVVINGLVMGLSNAILAVILAFNLFPLTDTQIAAINGLIAALIAVGTYIVQKRTVEVGDLSSDDGKPVTKESVARGQKVNWKS